MTESTVNHEMDLVSKQTRKFLMSIAPSVGVGKNDLFNFGYGGIVTVSIAVAFLTTFFYYGITNTNYNRHAKFLVPDNADTSGMLCSYVPLSLTGTYLLDTNGKWDSDPDYLQPDSLYQLTLYNGKYLSASDYQNKMKLIKEDFEAKSALSLKYDFASNLVFAGAYVMVDYTGGKTVFSVNSNSRVMFDLYGGYLSSRNGACGNIVASVNSDSHSVGYDLDSCSQTTVVPMGLYDGVVIDIASVTTAVAVNSGMLLLANLIAVGEAVDDVNGIVREYIHPRYQDMLPIACFIPIEYDIEGYAALCMLQFGFDWAFPIIQSHGTDDGSMFPPACTCNDYDYGCTGSYDLTFLVQPNPSDFDDQGNYTGSNNDTIFDLLRNITHDAREAEQTLAQYVRPLIQIGEAVAPNEYNETDMRDIYDEYCTNCYVLTISMGGTGFVNVDHNFDLELTCSNSPYYFEEAFDVMIGNPPTEINAPYLVCTESFRTSVSTGISNAYASAGLYSSLLLIVIMALIGIYHSLFHPDTPLRSVEESEVVLRNATAKILGKLIDKTEGLLEDEKEDLLKSLEKIGLVDPCKYGSSKVSSNLKPNPLTTADPEDGLALQELSK